MNLSPNFTYEQLTDTSKAVDLNGDGFLSDSEKEAFRKINRKQGMEFIAPLTRVALNFLEPLHEKFELIWVNSGFRGRDLNRLVNGSPTSQHCVGEAVDVTIPGWRDRQGMIAVMRWYIETKRPFGQLLMERGCIHYGAGDKREIAEAKFNTTTKRWDKITIPELVEYNA